MIGHVMGRVCPDALENMFSGWRETASHIEGLLATDGKRIRGARGPGDKMAPMHMDSAFSLANGVVLGQLKIDEKFNEIAAIPRLLEALHLTGATVTIDAGGCYAKIMNTPKQRNANFVIAIKDNPQTRLDDCSVVFYDADLAPSRPNAKRPRAKDSA